MPSVAKTALADVQAWVDRNVSAGAPACLAVLGISSGNLAVTLPEGKRAVSLPPGDVLVIVLPPGAGRQPGVFLAEANA